MSEPNLNALSTFKYARRIKFESKSEIKNLGMAGPGPVYSLVDTEKTKFAKAPSISMAAAERLEKSRSSGAPGPGQYGCAKPSCIQLGKGFGFGSQARLPNPAGKAKAPGPGTYTLPSHLGGVQVSITHCPQDSFKGENPGPGKYDPKFSQCENVAPAVSFTEGGFGKTPSTNVPGPGEYALQSTLGGNATLKRVPSYSCTSAAPLTRQTGGASASMIGQPTTFKIP